MIFKIYASDAATLLEKPETGMGYQIVNATQFNRTQLRKYVVYNSNLAVELNSDFQINKRKIILEGYENILNRAPDLMLNTASIKILEQSSIIEYIALSQSKKTLFKRHSGGKGATDSQTDYADGISKYIRISAYKDDKRIDFVNKKLKPGSFTTTFIDYNDCVATKDNPIDRYALPNDEEIKWAFYIIPKSIDQVQEGIVQPAFGHEGGGIEAYFEYGTSNNTYMETREYGK